MPLHDRGDADHRDVDVATSIVLADVVGGYPAGTDLETVLRAAYRAFGWIDAGGIPSFTSNAVLKATRSSTFIGKAISLRVASSTRTADAYIGSIVVGSFSSSAILLRTIGASVAADASISSATATGSIEASSVVRRVLSVTFTADADIAAAGGLDAFQSDAFQNDTFD